MNAFELVGVIAILAGLVQLLFRAPLTRTAQQAAHDMRLPKWFVSRSLLGFILWRCLPLWVFGVVLVIVGFVHAAR